MYRHTGGRTPSPRPWRTSPTGTRRRSSRGSGRPTEQGRLLSLATGLGELPTPELDLEVKVVQRAQLAPPWRGHAQEGGAGTSVPEQRTRPGRPPGRPPAQAPAAFACPRIAAGGSRSVWPRARSAEGRREFRRALPGDHLYGLNARHGRSQARHGGRRLRPRADLPGPGVDAAERGAPADGPRP